MDEKVLGGLLRDIVEALLDVPELPASSGPYWQRVQELRERVKEAFPA